MKCTLMYLKILLIVALVLISVGSLLAAIVCITLGIMYSKSNAFSLLMIPAGLMILLIGFISLDCTIALCKRWGL